MCKLSCNNFMWFVYCDNFLASYLTRHATYPRIYVSYVKQLRDIKMDDIYIYHAYTLSLLLSLFQKKQRRGRLIFQEREDDENMTRPDTTNIITTYSTLHKEKRGKQRDMIRCCSRSSPTSLWVQEKLESEFSTFWTEIRTAEIHLTSIGYNFCIRTPNWVNLFLLESLSLSRSSKIGLTSKFCPSQKLRPKESDPIAETGPEVQEKGVALSSGIRFQVDR